MPRNLGTGIRLFKTVLAGTIPRRRVWEKLSSIVMTCGTLSYRDNTGEECHRKRRTPGAKKRPEAMLDISPAPTVAKRSAGRGGGSERRREESGVHDVTEL